ncbi:MAG TPA: class I SAM-dependent methyltransferase [Candidatus Paceibacterota bacterium]
MNKLSKFLRRVFHGEDVILVQQTKEQWERQFANGTWDRLQEGQPNTAELARLISEYAGMRGAPVRVLDIGCGNGGLAKLIAMKPNIDYIGIDISETALAAARTVAPKARFIATDAEQPPSDIGTFDVFVFNEALYYMNPDSVLTRYCLYATADARIFISVLRFWRTPFIFHRIRRHLRIDTRFRIADRSHKWDIAVGHFI